MRWRGDPGGVCMNDDRRRDPLARPQIDTALGACVSETHFVGGFRIITSQWAFYIRNSKIVGPRIRLNFLRCWDWVGFALGLWFQSARSNNSARQGEVNVKNSMNCFENARCDYVHICMAERKLNVIRSGTA